jgi:hypothetical protein
LWILVDPAKPLQLFLSYLYEFKTNGNLFDKETTGKLKLLQI